MTKLILEIVDADTNCIAQEIQLTDAEASAACRLIEMEEVAFPAGAIFDLDRQEVFEITSSRALSVYSNCGFRLRRRGRLDDLPYEVHTNRELRLMLLGVKPLAVFSARLSDEPSLIPERFFAPHVEAGRIVRREYIEFCEKGRPISRIRRVLYALRHEEWRIDAYILLWNTACKTGWSAALERMEGHLLGYEDWQIEYYMNNIFNKERG